MARGCLFERRLRCCLAIAAGIVALSLGYRPSLLLADTKARQAKPPESPTDQLVKRIEQRLGREEDGHFVIVLKKTSFVYVQKRGRIEPFSHYFVDTIEGRRAAAESILEYMLEYRGLGPNPGEQFVGGKTPPPVGDWKAVGRYKTAGEAEQVAAQARVQFKARGTLLKHRPKVK